MIQIHEISNRVGLDEVVLQWICNYRTAAIFSEKPIKLVVPYRSTLNYIKEMLARENCSYAGIDAITINSLRSTLLDVVGLDEQLASREDARLIFSLVAEEFSDNAIAKGAIYHPETFLTLCDRLRCAGRPLSAFPLKEARILAEAFYKKMHELGLCTYAEADQKILETVLGNSREDRKAEDFFEEGFSCSFRKRVEDLKKKPLFGSLLFYGFSSAQWSHFSLMKVAEAFSGATTYCFLKEKPSLLSRSWKAYWKSSSVEPATPSAVDNHKGIPVEEIPSEETSSFDENSAMKSREVEIIKAENISTEANYIATRALSLLATGHPSRIGIIFPGKISPIARELAALLEKLNIPHNNMLGMYAPHSEAMALFSRWAAFQKTGQLENFLEFADTLYAQSRVDKAIYEGVKSSLIKAFKQCLTQNISVLVSYLVDIKEVALFFKEWPLLTPSANFSVFAEECLCFLRKIITEAELLSLFETACQRLMAKQNLVLSRELFLNWAECVLIKNNRIASDIGLQTFSPIQLMSAEEAVTQSWTHIIFAGLNQGAWPSEEKESPILDAKTVQLLNSDAWRSIVKTSASSNCDKKNPPEEKDPSSWKTTQSRNPIGMIAGAAEQTAIQESHFLQLAAHTPSITFTFSSKNPADPQRVAAISPFLTKYLCENRTHKGDLQWIVKNAHPKLTLETDPVSEPSDSAKKTHDAYTVRKEKNDTPSPFKYAFETPPPQGLSLPCKAWEEALTQPVTSWFRHVLKTYKKYFPAEENPTAETVGSWVHSWIALPSAAQNPIPIPEGSLWEKLVREHAYQTKHLVSQSIEKNNRELSDYWKFNWLRAYSIALNFIRELKEVPLGFVASEINLPHNPIKLPNQKELPATGRIDLLLSSHPCELESPPPNTNLWIIDFKTGGDPELTETSLKKGKGIQLALYGLSLKTQGFSDITLSILKADAHLKKQVSVINLDSLQPLWDKLSSIQKTGAFGSNENIRSEFSLSSSVPMTVLQ